MLSDHIQNSRAERAVQARKLAVEACATFTASEGATDAKMSAEGPSKASEPNDSSEKKGADGDAR